MRRAVLAVPLLLAGCDLGPQLDAPPPEAAARFVNAPADAPAVWPDTSWWRSFGSAELDRLVDAAAANNRDLRAASQRILQAEAAARIAAAPLYPGLTANSSVGRARSVGSASRAVVSNSFAGSLAASYEVDLWRRVRSGVSAGEARLLSSRYDRDATALSITAQTAINYVNLLAVRDRLQLARSTLEIAQRVLQVVLDQARAGNASDLEISQQQAAVASQQANLADLAGQERQALDAVAAIIGTRPDLARVAAASLTTMTVPAVPAGLPSDLLRRRPDIAKAEADFTAAGFDARVARAARFPVLSLTGQGGLQSRDLSDFMTPERAAWAIGTALAAPLLQGGRLAAGEDQAVARARELAESYAQAILAAFQDVEDSLAASVASQQSFALRQTAYAAALRAYEIAEQRWRAGGADFLSVLQAQQTAFATADQLVQANLARFTAVVGVYRALGGGWAPT